MSATLIPGATTGLPLPLIVVDTPCSGGPSRPFKHYACTPTRELPGNRIRLGAPRRLIVREMQDRAVHFVGNPAAVDHETRVADPAAAAAFWVWTQSGTPFAGLDPCCGCGVPTPMQCPCTRSWFCSLCTSHPIFDVNGAGRCRKCVCEMQVALGLR